MQEDVYYYIKVWTVRHSYCVLFFAFLITFCISLLMLSTAYTVPTIKPQTRVKQYCKFPTLDPWDNSVLKFLRDRDIFHCSKTPSLLYVDGDGILKYNFKVLKKPYEVDTKDLVCSSRRIERIINDIAIEYGPVFQINPPEFIPARFFRATCSVKGTVIYDNLHMNVKWKDDFSNSFVIPETDDRLSVFIFGIDSLSRSHFIRKLPKTLNFLTNNLNVYDFKNYVTVGKNSFPNLLPFLTGKAVSELPADYSNNYLDYLPFLWKEAAMLKYTTLYAEDRAHYSTFNYLKLGFRYPPTDYYFRPFMSAVESFDPVLIEQLGVTQHCLGNVEQYKLQIHFFKEFLHKYKSRLRLAFSWLNQLTHDNFNGIEYADKAFADLFMWMKSEGHLDNAIFIVMSDHGFRLDDFSTTLLGRLESQQPFLAVYLPDKLKRVYPYLAKNMKTNTERLVTPFDLHHTLQDVLYSRYNGTRAKTDQGIEKISLFTSLPEFRSCDDAGIPEPSCVCNLTVPVPVTLPIIGKLANFIVANINGIIESHNNGKLCELLQLYEVREASIVHSFGTDQSQGPVNLQETAEANIDGRYTLVIVTLPGQGLFEGLVDYINKNMKLVGKAARLNRYGGQSPCIKDDNIEQYCYCKTNHTDIP
ncbi:hypothetical protein ACJMK2_013243 [Sinanodonta woodiana]|uniref:DUF229 domain containing protein n=1 Tax=Sinanodonta woodiana TaxID=1069815 RepID=A0ABD3UWW0_SINWO